MSFYIILASMGNAKMLITVRTQDERVTFCTLLYPTEFFLPSLPILALVYFGFSVDNFEGMEVTGEHSVAIFDQGSACG